MKKLHRKYQGRGIGPGGWKCPCCAPAPGTPARRAQMRSAKRKQNREDMAMQDNHPQGERVLS